MEEYGTAGGIGEVLRERLRRRRRRRKRRSDGGDRGGGDGGEGGGALAESDGALSSACFPESLT